MTAAIVVEGVEIPTFLIAEEVQHHPGGSADEAWASAARALAVKALLLQRASELDLDAEPQVDDLGREETPEDALIRAVLDAELKVEPPSRADCRRFYDAHRDRFIAPPLTEASHILFEPGDQEDVDAAALRAQAVLQELLGNPAGFAEAARRVSTCPSAAVGGSLGQLSPGDVVGEIERALGELNAGQILPRPVRSRFGWHLLRLNRRIEGRHLPYAAVAGQIEAHLEERAWTSAAARYVAGLTEAARAQGVAIRLTRDGAARGSSLVLGDILGGGASPERIEAWLAAVDPELAGRLASAARDRGETPAEFARQAAIRFVNQANDERWTQLISAAQDADDPALAALAQILRSDLSPAPRRYTIFKRS